MTAVGGVAVYRRGPGQERHAGRRDRERRAARRAAVCEACEYSGALLVTVKKRGAAVVIPVGAEGGPTSAPATNVPSGADTDDTSGDLRELGGVAVHLGGVTPLVSGMTMVTFVARSSAKSVRS